MASVVVVDLDGVCYEFDRTARYMLRNFRGYTNLRGESTHWDHIKQSVDPADWQWLWSEGVERGLFRYGHMVSGARVGLERLRDRGYRLRVATKRPAQATSDTLDWISMYFQGIPLDGLHILGPDETKAQVNGDWLIDDNTDNLREWLDTGRKAIQFLQPWNEGWEVRCHIKCYEANAPSCLIRADGWSGVTEVLS